MDRSRQIALLVTGIGALLVIGALLFFQTRDPMMLVFAVQLAVVALVVGLVILFRPRGKDCPACRATNRGGARHCDQCGVVLAG